MIHRIDRSGVTHQLRPYGGADDDGVIMGPWRHHIRRERPFRYYPADLFQAYMKAVIEPMLDRVPIAISCNPEDSSQVHGWACGETVGQVDVLHFVWVKERGYRNLGIATALVAALFPQRAFPMHYTHPSRAAKDIAKKWKAVYNPYFALLRFPSPSLTQDRSPHADLERYI